MQHALTWNWQQNDWPKFRFSSAKLEVLEAKFLQQAGEFIGSIRHINDEEKQQLIIEIMSDEAVQTSEIEGEFLNRDSVQSSIRRNFGLTTDHRRIPPAEQGIAQMMVELFSKFDSPLNDHHLFHWHKMLMNGRQDLEPIGAYRTGKHAMQVVSGPIHNPKVHFEAPPSDRVQSEMSEFIRWFAEPSPANNLRLPILTRAGIAHLYFVSIHPFEDGNGRIARAISEKVISEGLGQPTLIALSQIINRNRNTYYTMLERSNKHNEITDWLVYFAETIISAQARAQEVVEFTISKTKFYDRFRDQLNERQDKVIHRMLQEGPEGFVGGLSAEKYIRMTRTSRATATRDLQDLIEKGALSRVGALKGTRYYLCFK